jgi:hypothetical protein
MTMLQLDGRAKATTWRERWRVVRDLLGGALILLVWIGMWTWVAIGVGAPLSRVRGDLSATPAAYHTPA